MSRDVERKEQRGFRDLTAWQKADRMGSLVYRACRELPSGHEWLNSQVVRCAISVPANIAEGHARGSQGDFLRFIDIARGSSAELEYYIHFMKNEGLLAEATLAGLAASQNETSKVLFGLWRSLKSLPKQDWDHTGRIAEEAGVYSADIELEPLVTSH
jgi:four helix bundle protein